MTDLGVPNPGVYRPTMFVCGADPDDSYVLFDALPADQISSALLEEASDWLQSLRSLPDGSVPDGVMAAMVGLNDAVSGWSEWLGRTEKRGPVAKKEK